MSGPKDDVPWLPEELYHTILGHLKPSRTSDESVLTLARCTATNRALRATAIAPTLWLAHYNIRYTHEDEQHAQSRRDEMMISCHAIYGRRRIADKVAVHMLDDLVRFEGGPKQRHDNAQDIVENYSFDVWDALEIEVSRPTPTPTAECLTRTWWAQNLLGTITRHHAISSWMEVHVASVGLRGSFERLFNALSSFFDCSYHQIQSKFDSLAAQCRDFLSEHEIVLPPSSSASSLREICEKIVTFMVIQGFGPVSDDNFTRLMNSFPHFFLRLNGQDNDDSAKRSIPISLVYVFCSIACRLNLDAHPLNFPNRVIARVCVVPGQAGPEDVYVDIFSGKVMSRTEGVPGLLQAAGIGDADAEEALALVPVGELLMRAARNIFNCLSTLGPGTAHPGTRAVRSASYAALAALAASTVRTQPAPQAIGASAAEQLPACLPHAPLDAIPIMQNLLTPALPWQVGAKLGKGVKAWLDDEIEDGAKVQRRKGKEKQTKRVRWFVGCHFKHRLFDYTGMVVGWTSKCEASEDWIRQMGVDGLPNGGRHQPFYNILDSEEQRRYVADCNIIPTQDLTDEMVATMRQTCPAMGQYFSRLSPPTEHGRRRFLLSAESSSCYPEDDEFGQRWVDTGEVEEIKLTGPLGAVFTLGVMQ